MGALLIILDPVLSVTTPEKIWLSTGMRAVDHCVEGICSFYATAESDEEASKGLKLLVPNLLVTKKDWENEDARLNEMFGVLHSMVGLNYDVPMGGSHAIGHQLGPLGVGHGETSCVMLPAVLRWTLEHGGERVREKQQKVLDVLWNEKTVVEVLKRRGMVKGQVDASDVVDAVVRELGMPRSLKEVGVGRDQLDALAVNCLKDRWLPTNAVPITTKEQVLSILEMVVGED